MPTNLPTITNPGQMMQLLKIWQQRLNPVVARPQPVRPPFNLSANSPANTTGILLTWEPVRGADGYIIYASNNGDFSGASVLATIASPAGTSFFDKYATGTRFYRIASTSGTVSQPQSVISNPSVPIRATAGGGTVYDNSTHLSITNPNPINCFSGNVEILLGDGSWRRFDELEALEKLEIRNLTGVHRVELIEHPGVYSQTIDMGGRQEVTLDHLMFNDASLGQEWVSADYYFPDAPRIESHKVDLFNLHVCSHDERDMHFVLKNGHIAHNLKKI